MYKYGQTRFTEILDDRDYVIKRCYYDENDIDYDYISDPDIEAYEFNDNEIELYTKFHNIYNILADIDLKISNRKEIYMKKIDYIAADYIDDDYESSSFMRNYLKNKYSYCDYVMLDFVHFFFALRRSHIKVDFKALDSALTQYVCLKEVLSDIHIGNFGYDGFNFKIFDYGGYGV